MKNSHIIQKCALYNLSGRKELLKAYNEGKSVTCEAFYRGNDAKPYAKGKAVIESIEVSAPAQDDTTYSINLSNDGAWEIDESNFKEATE